MALERKTRFRNPVWLDNYETERMGLRAMPRRRGLPLLFIVPKVGWNERLNREETIIYWRSREPEEDGRKKYLEVSGELKERAMDAYEGIR